MDSKRNTFYRKMAAAADIPKDLAVAAVLITVTGQEELYIENYKSIVEYTDCRLVLLAKNVRVEVLGKRLCITYYTKEEMKITGHIEQINYL